MSGAVAIPTRELLTHSRLSCFRSCPRRHLLRYEYGLRPEIEGHALRVGKAFHAAVEAAAKGVNVDVAIEAGLDDPYDLALVAAMFDGHERRWTEYPVTHVAAELPFDLPLVNPTTGRAAPKWRLAGKIDRIVRLEDGRLALMEYKSTSRDFAPGADYWTKLHLDQQLSIYVIAAREMGYDVATVLYDVTRRPALRPYKATPTEARKFTKDGRLYANQRENDETSEEYAARVAADIAEKPDHYFARIEIARLDQDLDECRAELWSQASALRDAKRMGRWYRNPDACFGQSFKCDFVPVCQMSGLDTVTPAGFVRGEIHPELVDATGGGHPSHATDRASGPIE